jgi:hypothetical protein
MKALNPFPLFVVWALVTASFGQQNPQKTYNWVPGNDETVRLDPGYYHNGPTYQAGWEGKKVQVEVNAEQPVTLAMVSTQDWNNASQHTETLGTLKYMCVQEHLVKATYTCDVPPYRAIVLLVRDERNDRGAFAGIGEVIRDRDRDRRDGDRDRDRHDGDQDRDRRDEDRRPYADRDRDRDARDTNRAIAEGVEAVMSGRSSRRFFAPNNVDLRYFDWACVENCNLPDPPHERVFNWVPIDDVTLRLDPGDYSAPRQYDSGVAMRADIAARQPVTISMIRLDYWKSVNDPNPAFRRDMTALDSLCVQQRTIKISYGCTAGYFGPYVLLVRDERREDSDGDHRDPREANSAAMAPPQVQARAPVHDAAARRDFASPNEVHVQYYGWRCVAYCDQPVFQWVSQVNEKYKLTNILKIYSGITPDHDGAPVSIKVKSPVPMAVAILPAKIAGQLYGKPDMFESAVENSSCQQRGVQSSTFQCKFNMADGPQSLVLLPEPGSAIPPKKKAEVQVQAVKCVENCDKLPGVN